MKIPFRYCISAICFILPAIFAYPSTNCFIELTDTLKAAEYFNKGELFLEQAEYDSAYYYLRESGKIYDKTGDWDSFAKCLIKIGEYYIINGDFNNAGKYLNRAEIISRQNIKKESSVFQKLYHLKGRLLLNQGNYKKSIDHLKKSIDICMNLIGYAVKS